MKTVGAVAILALGAASTLHAQAIITNGTIKMGINKFGHLNVPGGVLSAQGTTFNVGLRLLKGGKEYESTSDGCLCEGWGAGIATGPGAGTEGGADVDVGGVAGLTLVSFANTASTATSIVTIGGLLQVTHFYHPSAVSHLYQVDVDIKNISGVDLGTGGGPGLVYRRVMDWDIEPTAFSEHVKIHGWPAANLLHTSDEGFSNPKPLTPFGPSICAGAPINADFADSGPCDHGALFDFAFGALLAGNTKSFKTFYGADDTQAAVEADLGAVGVEVYSDASCRSGFAAGACPAIHAYGFEGVGGVSIGTPEPATFALLGTGLLGVFAVRRRRQA